MNSTAMAARYGQHQYQQRVGPQQTSGRRPTAGPAAMTPEQMRSQRDRQQMVAERQRRKEAEREADRDKIKATKPTDKTMPDGVQKLIVGDPEDNGVTQYNELRKVEKKLDSIMMRKYLDMQDRVEGRASFTSQQPSRKKIKLWVSNTAENQPWQGNGMDESAFDFNMGSEATYRVRIEGKVIEEKDYDDDGESEDDKDQDTEDRMDTTDGDAPSNGEKQGEGKNKAPPPTPGKPQMRTRERTKLSHFFKSMTVDFDRDRTLQPDGMTQVEWKRPVINPAIPNLATEFDSLEFERKSDENINCTINLYWDEDPARERFLLDKPLQNLLDTEVDDRASIIMGIWEYVKFMGLQQDENKRQIHCDERMKAVFGPSETIYFHHLQQLLQPHLYPLPPVSLAYTIRVDPDYAALPSGQKYTTYLLTVPPSVSRPSSARPSLPALQNLSKKDEHVAELIQAIGHSQRKHAFFSQMGKDPVTFTKRWMASQKRDLEIILGEDGRLEDGDALAGEWARGGRQGVWGREEVKEAVGLMVQRPDKAGRAF